MFPNSHSRIDGGECCYVVNGRVASKHRGVGIRKEALVYGLERRHIVFTICRGKKSQWWGTVECCWWVERSVYQIQNRVSVFITKETSAGARLLSIPREGDWKRTMDYVHEKLSDTVYCFSSQHE